MNEQNVTNAVAEVAEKTIGLSTPQKVAIFVASAAVGAGLVLAVKRFKDSQPKETFNEKNTVGAA